MRWAEEHGWHVQETELHTLPVSQTKSRGELPLRFFQSELSPKAFAKMLAKEGRQYNGFNLIVADYVSKTMFYVSNRPIGCPVLVQQAQRLRSNFQKLLGVCHDGGHEENTIPVENMVKMLMRDTTKADKSKLPCICPPDWEMSLSSIFVQVDTPLGRYGTRSTAALQVSLSGEASFYDLFGGQPVEGEKSRFPHPVISTKSRCVVQLIC